MKHNYIFHTLKGMSIVGFTSLSLFCLSSFSGVTSIVLSLVFLYIALFTSFAFRRSEA